MTDIPTPLEQSWYPWEAQDNLPDREPTEEEIEEWGV